MTKVTRKGKLVIARDKPEVIEIEQRIYDVLCKEIGQLAEADERMLFDSAGNTAFVVVAFNHPVDDDMFPADASADDKRAALISM